LLHSRIVVIGTSAAALTDEGTDDPLWKAVRALHEQGLRRRRMVDRAEERGP
jgi:hypothetical protein